MLLSSRKFPIEMISAVLDEDTGELMEYRGLMKKPKHRKLYASAPASVHSHRCTFSKGGSATCIASKGGAASTTSKGGATGTLCNTAPRYAGT